MRESYHSKKIGRAEGTAATNMYPKKRQEAIHVSRTAKTNPILQRTRRQNDEVIAQTWMREAEGD